MTDSRYCWVGVFGDKVSLPQGSGCCPRKHFVDQAGLELAELYLPLPPLCWC